MQYFVQMTIVAKRPPATGEVLAEVRDLEPGTTLMSVYLEIYETLCARAGLRFNEALVTSFTCEPNRIL